VRLNAYYFGFDSTGNEDIDRILSAVACAGKAYHLTKDWTNPTTEPYEPSHRGGTCAEWIQNAAVDAATKLAAIHREGVIEGLRIASQIYENDNRAPGDAIRAEIERLKREQR
jgi:hypothetical protein